VRKRGKNTYSLTHEVKYRRVPSALSHTPANTTPTNESLWSHPFHPQSGTVTAGMPVRVRWGWRRQRHRRHLQLSPMPCLHMRIVRALSLASPPSCTPCRSSSQASSLPGLAALVRTNPRTYLCPLRSFVLVPCPAHARSHCALAHLYPPGRVCTLLDTTIPANKE